MDDQKDFIKNMVDSILKGEGKSVDKEPTSKIKRIAYTEKESFGSIGTYEITDPSAELPYETSAYLNNYETIDGYPNIIILDAYPTKEAALVGHEIWIKIIEDSPETLKEEQNNAIAKEYTKLTGSPLVLYKKGSRKDSHRLIGKGTITKENFLDTILPELYEMIEANLTKADEDNPILTGSVKIPEGFITRSSEIDFHKVEYLIEEKFPRHKCIARVLSMSENPKLFALSFFLGTPKIKE